MRNNNLRDSLNSRKPQYTNRLLTNTNSTSFKSSVKVNYPKRGISSDSAREAHYTSNIKYQPQSVTNSTGQGKIFLIITSDSGLKSLIYQQEQRPSTTTSKTAQNFARNNTTK